MVSDWGISWWSHPEEAPLAVRVSALVVSSMTVSFFSANHRVMGAREEMWEHCKLQVV